MTQAYNLSQLANNLNTTGQLDATDGLVNAVPATNGGTGQSAYAVGDLLFANTATALSKLADVATGNAIISGGVGVAPAYGKVGLTTHVSGTLPVGNGGTGLPTLTANNVILGNGTSAVQAVAPGTSGNILTSNGTTWASAAVATVAVNGAFRSMQVFTSSGTYTKPAGLVRAKITVVGGGVGGSGGTAYAPYGTAANYGFGGGGGGTAIKLVATASIGATETITIGAGGAGGAGGTGGSYGSPGGSGGTSSFGAIVSAAGIGASGDLNLAGDYPPSNAGGGSYFGRSYGGGGNGGGIGSAGSNGTAGVILIEEFF